MEFSTTRDSIDTDVVWIRLPELPLHLYHEKLVHKIGSAVGRIIKIDNDTTEANRGKYARIAVAINLRWLLVSKVKVKNYVQLIEYENLPHIFFSCEKAGHRSTDCSFSNSVKKTSEDVSTKSVPPSSLETEKFDKWMVVTRKGRRSKNQKDFDYGK